MQLDLDVIVQTKFYPPILRSTSVRRPRLAALLRAAFAGQKLTLVAAPAGYGKTTLVAGALRDHAPRSLWMACDPEDDDPARFLLVLIQGLRQLHPQCGALAQALLASLENPAAEVRRVIGVLINEIVEWLPGPCVVVFDDLHAVADPAIYAGLDYLLERLPAGMHLVATARADLPLALGRLRAQGQITEIRLADLCFTQAETAALLTDQFALGLSADNLRLVQQSVAGWAAGLSLVATTLRRQAYADEQWELIDALARADHLIFDFLAEEVMRHEDAATRDFLLETSILSDLTPELCAAVTGRDDAQAALDRLYRRNLFVVSVDPAGRVLRYQPLFASFLRAQRERLMPERAAELHRRAARAETAPERAIPHFLAADEWLPAARLIERIGEQWIGRGLVDQVQAWLLALPANLRAERPALQYLLGLVAWRLGRIQEAGAYLAAAVAGTRLAPDSGGGSVESPVAEAALVQLANWAFMQSDFARSAELIDEGLAALASAAAPAPGSGGIAPARGSSGLLPSAPAARILLLLGKFRLEFMQRRWPQALALFDEALDLCDRAADGEVFALLVNQVNVSMVGGLTGGLERLERLGRWAERWPAAAVGPTRVALDTQQAVICLSRGAMAPALEAGQRALDLIQRLGGTTPNLGVFAPGLVATLYLARDDHAAADAAFAQMLAQLEQGVLAGPLLITAIYSLGRARWQQGRLDEARDLHRRLRAIESGGVPAGALFGQLLGGLLALSDGRLAEAERLLRQAAELEPIIGPPARILGSARLALAYFYERCGRPAEALAELAPLLAECADERRPGLIVREGQMIVPLLRLAVRRGIHPALAGDILSRLGDAEDAPQRPLHNPATGETLSAREVEVLRLLMAGATNKAIADALVISAATVKTHLLHIFQKLDVRTRTAAAARARELLGR